MVNLGRDDDTIPGRPASRTHRPGEEASPRLPSPGFQHDLERPCPRARRAT